MIVNSSVAVLVNIQITVWLFNISFHQHVVKNSSYTQTMYYIRVLSTVRIYKSDLKHTAWHPIYRKTPNCRNTCKRPAEPAITMHLFMKFFTVSIIKYSHFKQTELFCFSEISSWRQEKILPLNTIFVYSKLTPILSCGQGHHRFSAHY